jgi:hypothetical protein
MARIDDSKHPWKRKTKTVRGPRKRAPYSQAGKYVCKKSTAVPKGMTKAEAKLYYIQQCKVVATGRTFPVLTEKAWKKDYNAARRDWLKTAAGKAEAARAAKGRRKGYKCKTDNRTPKVKCK